MSPGGLGGAGACRSTALVGKVTRWAWCRSILLNGESVRWPGIARLASDSGHAEVGPSASSSSPGARGCTSDRQRPSLERNASTATAHAAGHAWHVSTCASRDCRWSKTLQRRWLAQWAQAWHVSMCASRDRHWRETLQRQRLTQWGWRWVCGDPIRWDPKVQVTCSRVGHISVHAESTQHWAVAKMRHWVRYCRRLSTMCPSEQTAPRRCL